MNQTDALSRLRGLYSTAFTTRDAAHLLGSSVNATSKILDGLSEVGLLVHAMRGKWLVPDKFNRLLLPELIAGQPAYVSMQSALSYHGMIDQIPSAVYGVTCGRGSLRKTPVGTVSLHHVTPEFFTGYETPTDISWLKIATPEKALVDALYFRMTSQSDFKALPEVEFSKTFSWKRAKEFAQLTPSLARRGMIEASLDELRATRNRHYRIS